MITQDSSYFIVQGFNYCFHLIAIDVLVFNYNYKLSVYGKDDILVLLNSKV